MSFVIGILTFILFLDSLFLMLLILIQLPKKEAGAGTAFGGGATDALFGAGTGNALTKLTKWSAGVFLGLALLLSVVNASNRGGVSNIRKGLGKQAAPAPAAPVPALTPGADAGKAVITPAITNISDALGAAPVVPAGSNAVVTTNAGNLLKVTADNLTQTITNIVTIASNTAVRAVPATGAAPVAPVPATNAPAKK